MFEFFVNNIDIILAVSLTAFGVCTAFFGVASFVMGAVEIKIAKEWEKLEKLEWNIDEENRRGKK